MKKIEIHPLHGFTAKNIELISARRKEPGWMLKKRQLAYQHFCDKKFPDEFSQRSTIDPPALKIFLDARGKNMNSPDERRVSGYLLQAESTAQKIYLNKASYIKHIQFSSINDGRKFHEEIFRKYFDSFPSLADWIFSDMNLAAFSNGAFLYIPKNVKCDCPFIISSKIFSRGLCQFKRNLFICGERSESQIIFHAEAEEWDDAVNLSVETTEIIVESGAKCTLLIDQKWLSNVWNFHTIRVEVQTGGNFNILLENSEATISMIDFTVYLKAPAAACHIKSNSSSKNEERRGDHFRIFHENPKTTSRLDLVNFSRNSSTIRKHVNVSMRGAARDSKSDINFINMVFDPKSQIEIQENSHVQNTTSQLNKVVQYVSLSQAQINYLQTKWMDTKRIENLLIETAKKKLMW